MFFKQHRFSKFINSFLIILVGVFIVGGVVYAARYIGYESALPGFKMDDNVIITGKVGVGTTTPGYKLDVQGGQINTSGGLCITGDCKTAWNQVGGQWTTSGTSIYYNGGNVGIGMASPDDKLDISGGNFDLNGNSIKNVNKLTVNTIDPVYNINGKKYATYVPDIAGGVTIETMGKIEVRAPADSNGGYQSSLSLSRQPEGSDLWLFYQASDLGEEMENLIVLLTPRGKGNLIVSYDFIPQNQQLIIYSSQPATVSYRLLAPRIDHQKWSNVADDQEAEGINVLEYRR